MGFYRGRVKCAKIERMLLELNKMVEKEMIAMISQNTRHRLNTA